MPTREKMLDFRREYAILTVKRHMAAKPQPDREAFIAYWKDYGEVKSSITIAEGCVLMLLSYHFGVAATVGAGRNVVR